MRNVIPHPQRRGNAFQFLATVFAVLSLGTCVAQAQDGDNQSEQSQAIELLESGSFKLPKLAARSIVTDTIGNGRTPDDFRQGAASPMIALPEDAQQRVPGWNWTVAQWTAANTFSSPLYFEDRMLERHGHERFGVFQPFAAGARFFTTTSMLSYLSALQPPWKRQYTLGYYRAGSCAPRMLQRPPYDKDAMISQAASTAVTSLALP